MASPLNKNEACPASDGDRSPESKSFSVSGSSHLPRRLALIFCSLALISIGVNLKFIWDTGSPVQQMSGSQIIGALGTHGASEIDQKGLLAAQRNRLLVLLGITAFSFAGIIYLYVRKVVVPLETVVRAAREISKGNLKVTAPANPTAQIGELAGAINDLAANFQEVLLLTGTTLGNTRAALDRIENSLGHEGQLSHDELQRQIGLIRVDLEMLDSVVKEFDFYQVRFDGRKVIQDRRRSKC